MKPFLNIFRRITEQHGFLFLIANLVIIICTIIILYAILSDFVKYHRPYESKRKINSWVETGTMLLYFFIYYLLMQLKTGRIITASKGITNLLIIAGIILVIAGCYVNIMGRRILQHNWANQVTIYHDHTFVSGNVYKIIRHPLYASLIWMLSGGCLVYSNYIALLSVVFIFIPMMYFRAKQEETLLLAEFAEYSDYQKQTGMFFPKIFKYGKI
jgi:protein-S-isoprenylcysteine O-methyltransferase Ste14